MADERYNSAFTGQQIDDAVGFYHNHSGKLLPLTVTGTVEMGDAASGTIADLSADYDAIKAAADAGRTVVIHLTDSAAGMLILPLLALQTAENVLVFGAPMGSSILFVEVTGGDASGVAWTLQAAGGGSAEEAVLYTAQTLTAEQQTQARTNIGAVSENDVANIAEEALFPSLGGAVYASQAGAVTWDGVIGDKPYVHFGDDTYLVCITEEVPTVMSGGHYAQIAMSQFMGEAVATFGGSTALVGLGDVFLTADELLAIVPSDNYELNDIVFPKKGVYVFAANGLANGVDWSSAYISAVRIAGYSFADQGGVKSWNDLEDKPFYPAVDAPVIYDQTITVINDSSDPAYVDTTIPFVLVDGDTYTVEVNGVSTTTVARASSGSVAMIVETDIPASSSTTSNAFVVNYVAGNGCSFEFSSLAADATVHVKITHDSGAKEGKLIDYDVLPEALRFGEITTGGDTLEWDGNTEGLVAVLNYYKVSDAIITKNDVANGLVLTLAGEKVVVTGEDVQENFVDDGYALPGAIVFIPTDNYTTANNTVFPKSGVYFISMGDTHVSALTIPGYTGFTKTKVKTIEPEYLPGAVVLYVDAESYLCSDSAASKRITVAQLRAFLESGRAIYATLGNGGYYLASTVAVFDSYGYGLFCTATLNGAEFTPAYTAEYTAS